MSVAVAAPAAASACVEGEERRTAQVTSISERWNRELLESEVPLFCTLPDGETACVRVTGVPCRVALELGDVIADEELDQLCVSLDKNVREWIWRRAKSERKSMLECGRSNCSMCGMNAWAYDENENRVKREQRTFSTQPCVRALAEAHARTPRACVKSVRRTHARPMSCYVPAPIEFAEFELGGAYYASRVASALRKWIDEKGWRDSGRVRGCGVEVCEVRPDTVLAFLDATHALSTEASLEKGADSITGFTHVILPPVFDQILGDARISNCAQEYVVDFPTLRWDRSIVATAPLRIAAFDLETTHLDPTKGSVLMASFVTRCKHLPRGTQRLRGRPAEAAHLIITPGTRTRDVKMPENARAVTVHIVDDEAALLVKFAELVRTYDPDMITGYNSDVFDFAFLWKRAQLLGDDTLARFERMSRIPNMRCTQSILTRKSRQSGTRFVTFYNFPGRTIFDMKNEVMARRQLSNYKLDHVGFTVFVEDPFGRDVATLAKTAKIAEFEAAVTAKLMKKLCADEAARKAARILADATKRDMHYTEIVPHHNGTAEQRGELAEYCVHDAEIPLDLEEAFGVVTALAAKAVVCGIAPHHVPTMMQQALLSRAFQRFCHVHRVFKAKHRQMARADFPEGYFGKHSNGVFPRPAPKPDAPGQAASSSSARKRRARSTSTASREDHEVASLVTATSASAGAEARDLTDVEGDDDDDPGYDAEEEEEEGAPDESQEWIEPDPEDDDVVEVARVFGAATISGSGAAPAPASRAKPRTAEQIQKAEERAVKEEEKRLQKAAEYASEMLAFVPAHFGDKPPRMTEWVEGVPYLDPTDVRTTEKNYAGGYVREPKPGLYTLPIGVLDFNSMYPNEMRRHNLSPNTRLQPGWRDMPLFAHLTDEDVTEGLMGAHWIKQRIYTGIFLHILEYFLNERARFRELAKALKQSDPVLSQMYDALQNQCKVLANSLYGATGAPSSDFADVHVAAETTGRGSTMIRKVAHRLETHPEYKKVFDLHAPELIGGDTDSVFVLAASRDMFEWEAGIRVGRPKMDVVFRKFTWLRDDMNKCGIYSPPAVIGVDGISERSLFEEKKKRYLMVAWTDPEKPPEIKSKGMELVRRDTLPATRYTLERMRDLVLDVNRDVDRRSVYAIVRADAQAFLGGKLPVEAFVLSQKITKPLHEYKGKVAHVELLKRLERENPALPKTPVGDRVQFVYAFVEGATHQWMRVRTPEEVKESGGALKVDYILNYVKRFRGPVERFLLPWCPPAEVATLLDLERYSYDASFTSATKGRGATSKRHKAQRDLRDCFEEMKRKRDAAAMEVTE